MKTTYLTVLAVITTSLTWGQYTTVWPSTSTPNTSAAGYVGIGTKATSTSTTNPSFDLHLHGTTDYTEMGKFGLPVNYGPTTRLGFTNTTTLGTAADGTVLRQSQNDFSITNKEGGALSLLTGSVVFGMQGGTLNRAYMGSSSVSGTEYALMNYIANGDNGLYIKTQGLGQYGLAIRTNSLTDNAVQIMGNDGTPRFIVKSGGYTEINTTSTTPGDKLFLVKNSSNYKLLQLTNDGVLRAREIIVDAQSWADYVFEPSYKLRSLDEVRSFIAENKHLPNVPSTSEVNEAGVNLAKTDAILLEKIEELTLYLLQQDEQIKQLKAELKSLKQDKTNK